MNMFKYYAVYIQIPFKIEKKKSMSVCSYQALAWMWLSMGMHKFCVIMCVCDCSMGQQCQA